jgi:hypothetical protein
MVICPFDEGTEVKIDVILLFTFGKNGGFL